MKVTKCPKCNEITTFTASYTVSVPANSPIDMGENNLMYVNTSLEVQGTQLPYEEKKPVCWCDANKDIIKVSDIIVIDFDYDTYNQQYNSLLADPNADKKELKRLEEIITKAKS